MTPDLYTLPSHGWATLDVGLIRPLGEEQAACPRAGGRPPSTAAASGYMMLAPTPRDDDAADHEPTERSVVAHESSNQHGSGWENSKSRPLDPESSASTKLRHSPMSGRGYPRPVRSDGAARRRCRTGGRPGRRTRTAARRGRRTSRSMWRRGPALGRAVRRARRSPSRSGRDAAAAAPGGRARWTAEGGDLLHGKARVAGPVGEHEPVLASWIGLAR